MTHEYVTKQRPALDIPLVTRELWQRVPDFPPPFHLQVTPSTQLAAQQFLADGVPAPFVVTADEQTAGRGRLDRRWVAPAGSAVLMSLVLPFSGQSALPLRIGTAVLEVLQRYAPDLALKWPNDIVRLESDNVRKLGGIIAELVPAAEAVIVGIGINVALTPDELPTPEALSLAQLGPVPGRELLIAEIVAACAAPGEVDLDRYRRACCTLGQRVRVSRLDGEPLEGTAVGIDDEGALLLEIDGMLQAVSAGDVMHVRPGEGS